MSSTQDTGPGDNAVRGQAAAGSVVRKRMRFFGWVQGVGFRWRARNAAESLGCTGWVSNEFDGSVLMELQGTEEQIDRVILAVEQGRYVRIENMSVETIPLQDDCGFHVR